MKSKKNLLFSLVAGLAFSFATQAQVYENGKNYLNAGIGVGTFYRGLPFGLSYERGVTDDISVGGFFDYSAAKYSYGSLGGFFGNSLDGRLTILFVGARASYHFNKLLNMDNNKVDLYGGAALGFRSVSWKYDDEDLNNNSLFSDPYSSGILFGIHAGARYMFSENIGGFAELGYGVSVLKLGLAVKF
jgi:hypothetical protein